MRRDFLSLLNPHGVLGRSQDSKGGHKYLFIPDSCVADASPTPIEYSIPTTQRRLSMYITTSTRYTLGSRGNNKQRVLHILLAPMKKMSSSSSSPTLHGHAILEYGWLMSNLSDLELVEPTLPEYKARGSYRRTTVSHCPRTWTCQI